MIYKKNNNTRIMCDNEIIELICVKIQNKLRIRITSPNYFHESNVQFPKDIRIEGRRYRVNKKYISLIETRSKYYYYCKNYNCIEIIGETANITIDKIYENEENEDCIICMSCPKNIVFTPCFHFYCCDICSNKVSNCPICRSTITQKIKKSNIG